MTHFAVQMLPGEDLKSAVGLVCRTAAGNKCMFTKLESYGTINLGGRIFLRCQVDKDQVQGLLDSLYGLGRGVIEGSREGYKVRLTDGRQRPIPITQMHTVAGPGLKTQFRGPGVKLWDRQFD
jgi:hypothetical protein